MKINLEDKILFNELLVFYLLGCQLHEGKEFWWGFFSQSYEHLELSTHFIVHI